MRKKANLWRGAAAALIVVAIWAALSLRYVYLGVEAATLAVLFMTFLAVVWYADETHLLRLQHFRPYILVRRLRTNKYCYLNAGNGAALNIRVKHAVVGKEKVPGAWDFVDHLAPGEKSHEYVFSGALTPGSAPDPAERIVVSESDAVFSATVAYEDVEGNCYETGMEFPMLDGRIAGRVKRSVRRSGAAATS